MEHFLEESGALLRLWSLNSEERICICYYSHLNSFGLMDKVLTEHFFQDNVPIQHLPNVMKREICHQRSK